jgi:histidinol-phosphatase (PHP family)
MEGFVEGFLAARRFELVLMSVHFVGGWPGESWVFDLPRDRSLGRIYADYFRCVKEGIAAGLFDCVAHLDLIKQPGLPVLGASRGDLEEILALCRERGMSMEINASGTRKKIAECYPAAGVAAMALDSGVRFTPGSDAHAPEQVGPSRQAMSIRSSAERS